MIMPGFLPYKIHGAILKVDQRRTSTNGPENKKNKDDALVLTS